MGDVESLSILDELQSIVSDQLQVVSYKWLSRNYLVSSNEAKRLLQDYVEKHGTGLAVLYSISGWVKNNPSSYHVRLVSKPKLEEAKLDFDGNCSVQVYSVQSCIPKDPAALWNAEFVQAEELFKQPVAIDNCLRDNRLCGVSNSFVKRNGGAESVKVAAHPVKSLGSGLSKDIPALKSVNDAQSEQKRFQPSTTTAGPLSSSITKEVETEPYAHASKVADGKTALEKEKYPQPAADKKKAHVDQNSNRSSATLANMWGRAKPKPDNTLTETTNAATNSAAIAAAQTKVNEFSHCDSSDDDGQQVNTRRAPNLEGNRKRRVVFDFSDEEDELGDAVNLASPDLPNKKPAITMKQDADIPMVEKKTLFVEGNVEDKSKIVNKKDEKNNDLSLSEEPSRANNGKKSDASCNASNQIKGYDVIIDDKMANAAPSRANNGKKSDASCNASKQIKGNDVIIDDKMDNAAPVLPKRRKVLKTRINERGKEVTEVVWEDEGVDSKSSGHTSKETETSVKTEVNRFPATKKSPALATNPPQGGKGGNKKAGIKDPKQGNILSFFKKKA